MATSTYGTPYVQSTDTVSGYPTVSANLATRVDDVSVKGNGINAQTGTSYTLVLGDAGKTVTLSNASAVALTVPTNASVAYAVGSGIALINLGAGTVTVAGAGGVTVNGSTLTMSQYDGMVLRKTATDTWIAIKGGGSPKASISSTTGSPATGNVTYSGTTWDYWKWTASGTVTTGISGLLDIVVVGGGAGGGTTGNFGGGKGGGGAVISKRIWVPAGTYSIQIGATASVGATGNGSVFDKYLGIGGGYGGAGGTGGGGGAGGAGASGGGGGYEGAGGAAGAALYNGAFGYAGQNGNSGWAGGAGGASSTSASGIGLTVWAGTFGAGGTGGAGAANTGNGGLNATTGGSGVVYLGVPR